MTIAPARQIAFDLLSRIELRHDHSDSALHTVELNGADARDMRLVTDLVYGSLRWKAYLDFILARAADQPWRRISPEMRIILRMSLYPILFMDRVPQHAVVNDAVELAKRLPGHKGHAFVNGILRNLLRERPWEADDFSHRCPDWARVSLPHWLWDRWVLRFGKDEARAYALSLNQPPRIAYRVASDANRAELEQLGEPSHLVPGAILQETSTAIARAAGRESGLPVQDEASQLIPHLFGPIPGRRIWDACAAPGGKTAILCDLARPEGTVVASDVRWERAILLARRLKCMPDARCDLVVADARRTPPFREKFDAVLVDAPCSGLGTLRRNPEIKWRIRPRRLPQLAMVQGEILANASMAVRQCGRLLYSTCSTEPEENEQVIVGFLKTNPHFELIRPEWPPGIEVWTRTDGAVRTYPSERLWDGFFAALMVRKN